MLNPLPARFVDTLPKLIALMGGVCIALMALVFASPALAEKGKLRERLTPEVMAVVYPAGAERLGAEEGAPPAIAVLKDDKPVAYVFSTVASPGPRLSSTTRTTSFTTAYASACSTRFSPVKPAGRCVARPRTCCR